MENQSNQAVGPQSLHLRSVIVDVDHDASEDPDKNTTVNWVPVKVGNELVNHKSTPNFHDSEHFFREQEI